MESVKEIGPLIADWVGDSGTCPDNGEKLLNAINQIRRLLWNSMDFTTQMEWVEICCASKCFFLPARYEVVRYVTICNQPLILQNEWYQQAAAGDWGKFPCVNFSEDKGGYYSKFREYSENPYSIEIAGENGADKGKEIQFETRNSFSRWGKLTLKLGDAFIYVSSPKKFVSFNRVTKPITLGGVRVYAKDLITNTRSLLAIYQPWETNPNYKKYSVPTCCQNVRVKAKLRYRDLDNENDLVEFPVEAMIYGAQAITYRKARDMQNFTLNMNMAISDLYQEMADNETRGSSPIKFHFPTIGNLLNTEGAWSRW